MKDERERKEKKKKEKEYTQFQIDFTAVKDELLLPERPPVDCCFSLACLLTLLVAWCCLIQHAKKSKRTHSNATSSAS